MPQKRHKPEEIVAKLRQVDVLVLQGQSAVEAVRSISVTQFTYYRWRKEFAVIGVLTALFILRGVPGHVRSELPIVAPSVQARWATVRSSSPSCSGRDRCRGSEDGIYQTG